jgi:cell cycle sensor histidine kinase DivJ
VNGILDMSKMESGNFEITPEPCAPGEIVTGCCDILALKAREAGVELAVNAPRSLPEIVADRRAMSQVLINLVSNAIKFTDRGGRVTVTASIEAASLKLTVEDTGVGIGADDLPRLGEAFFQARASYDRRHDGTGLGLSIVKGLVQLHGGTTDIRSKLGVGTCVTVKLPLDCEGKRPAAQPVALVSKKTETPRAAAERQVRKSA